MERIFRSQHGRAPKALAPILVCAAIALSGCGLLSQILSSLEDYRPRIAVQDVAITGVSWDAIDLEFTLKIANPNPIEVTLDSFRYALEIDGQPLLKGDQGTGVPFKSYGTSEAKLPLKLSWTKILSVVPTIQKKSKIPFRLTGSFGFKTPLGMLDVPWNKRGSVPKLSPPNVVPAGLRLVGGNLLGGQLELALDLDVSNPDGNGMIEISAFAFEVALDGRQAASGKVSKLAEIPQGKTQRVPLKIIVRVGEVGLLLFKRLNNHGDVQVRLGATAQVKTPVGTFPLRVQRTIGKHVN